MGSSFGSLASPPLLTRPLSPSPAPPRAGDRVTAGTVNYDGRLTVRATASGGDTAVSDILRLVEAAQARAAPIQRLADVVAGKFTYGVMAASAATFVFWAAAGTKLFPQALAPYLSTAASKGAASLLLSFQLACNVLVVACPCALGLAAPTAVLVGTGAAARRGLLVRGGDVLEAASGVDTVVFDKTGTLTAGKPAVVGTQMLGADAAAGISAQEMLELAAAVEAGSTHPIAKAIVAAAGGAGGGREGVQEGSFTQQPGSGVVGTVGGRRVTVGSLEWVQEHAAAYAVETAATSNGNGASSPLAAAQPAVAAEAAVASRPGHILVYVGVDAHLVGAVEIADELRPDAAAVIIALRAAGILPLMLSGDAAATAHAVGAAVGLDPKSVFAGVKPAGKAALIERLQAEGRRVAMVGDGVNDAAALAQADVGIAMGGGVDAASEVADVVLLGDRVPQVLDVLHLSRETLRTIKQNMAWAFGYNVVCLPLAAGALLPGLGIGLTPALSGALMGASSLAVMANSLLLQYKIGPAPPVRQGVGKKEGGGKASAGPQGGAPVAAA